MTSLSLPNSEFKEVNSSTPSISPPEVDGHTRQPSYASSSSHVIDWDAPVQLPSKGNFTYHDNYITRSNTYGNTYSLLQEANLAVYVYGNDWKNHPCEHGMHSRNNSQHAKHDVNGKGIRCSECSGCKQCERIFDFIKINSEANVVHGHYHTSYYTNKYGKLTGPLNVWRQLDDWRDDMDDNTLRIKMSKKHIFVEQDEYYNDYEIKGEDGNWYTEDEQPHANHIGGW